eukprot:jgi/Orpsp1_1/1187706/evm.model.d7180000059568.1
MVKELINLGVSLELKTQNGIELKELIKIKLPELYRTEIFITENETIEEILDSKEENIASNIIKEKGLDINKEDDNGKTSLENAIVNQDLEKTKQLIRLGADMKKADGLIQNMMENSLCGLEMNNFISDLRIEYPEMMNEVEYRNYYTLACNYIKMENFDEVINMHSKCKDIFRYQKEGELNLLTQMIIKTNDKNIDKLEEIINNQKDIINNINIVVNKVNGTTPIHYVMEKIKINSHAIELLKLILSYITKENVNVIEQKNNNEISVLDYSIALNNIEAIKLIYQKIVDSKSDASNKLDNVVHIQFALFNNNITKTKLKEIITGIVSIKKKDSDKTLLTTEDIINDNSIINSQTILHIAFFSGKLDIIEELFKYKDTNIKVDITDKWRRTPIFYAVIAQKNDIINYFKDIKRELIYKKDIYNVTPIHYAVMNKNLDIVNNLICNSNTMDFNDNERRTLLHYAVLSQELEIVKSVILTYFGGDDNKIIDFNKKDDNGLRALDYLLLGEIDDDEMEDIIRNFISKNEDYVHSLTNLYIACENKINPDKAIKLVVEKIEKELPNLINVPLKDKMFLQKQLNDETPLQLLLNNDAISNKIIVTLIKKSNLLNKDKRIDLIKLLIHFQKEDIAKELNINKEYYSLLMNSPQLIYDKIKKSKADEKAIKEFLKIDSSIDYKGFYLYDYAIVKDRYDLYCEFIKHDNVNIDNVKKREVINAALNLNIKLVSAGIKYNGNNKRIQGLLHIAAKKNSIDLAEKLLDFYDHLKLFKEVDKNGKTACDIALDSKDDKIINYFIMRGGSINAINGDNLSALDISVNETIETAKYLNYLSHDLSRFNKIGSSDLEKEDKLGNTLLFYVL